MRNLHYCICIYQAIFFGFFSLISFYKIYFEFTNVKSNNIGRDTDGFTLLNYIDLEKCVCGNNNNS